MKKLLSSLPINMDLGLLLIRIILGVLMACYGYNKLIHFDQMAAFFGKINFLGMTGKIPLALTIFAEFFCSLLLIVGLLTRLSLIPLLICMGYIVAVMDNMEIYKAGDNGTEFQSAFIYFVIYLALFFTGPGRYSVDSALLKK
ncbi:MAG: DoxX family protein [Flavobacterium sp. BFFFF1]|uniref:DoxX family protein n=1 Tax=unclassified Flavobacterium TaxID=196869 RepID=UPI000BDB8BA0|nr:MULTISPECIES: DoxX family protein [unclassified Flavobacterium]OYU80324.1 MAG: DoxX family protein [Flavobacterium sp. BFFFF1]